MGNLVKFRGGGIVLRSLPVVLDCGFAEIFTGAYPCFSKLSVYFKLRGKRGLMSSWVSACCKDRAISWYASGVVRLNSRGGGVVLKFDVLQDWNAVFVQFACKQ